MDLFVHVCERLRAGEMRHLRLRAEEPRATARFSTWLVVIVRHLVVDWFRRRDGRRRVGALVEDLSPRRRRIFELVFLDRCSHAEAFELLRGEAPELTFHEFLADLRETYRAVNSGRRGALLRELGPEPPSAGTDDPRTPVEATERNLHLQRVLAELSPEDRLAVQLYVVEDLSAEAVAIILGLRGAKAVYNRIYRVLNHLRASLDRAGIRRGDL